MRVSVVGKGNLADALRDACVREGLPIVPLEQLALGDVALHVSSGREPEACAAPGVALIQGAASVPLPEVLPAALEAPGPARLVQNVLAAVTQHAASAPRGVPTRLETPRLILREWEQADMDDLVEGLNDLAVSRWLAVVPYPYTPEHGRQWLAYCAQSRAKGPERNGYDWAIELKAENKVIGGTSLDRISRLHRTGGGGIWISARYHGRGYGQEAFGARTRFAFETLGLRRLEDGCFAGNHASLKMQERLGYKVEGLRRKAFICQADGQERDEVITSLLREEYVNPPMDTDAHR